MPLKNEDRLLLCDLNGQNIYLTIEGSEMFLQFGNNVDNYKYWLKALKDLRDEYTFDTQCGLKVNRKELEPIFMKIDLLMGIL